MRFTALALVLVASTASADDAPVKPEAPAAARSLQPPLRATATRRPQPASTLASASSTVEPVAAAAPAQPVASVIANPTPRSSRRAKWIAAGSIAAIHGTFIAWQYLAWDRKGTEPFHYEGGPALSVDSYAGGADKFGHAWGTYALTRAETAILAHAGWPRLASSAVAFGLTESAFLMIEIQDGHAPYGFDKRDFAANLLGGAFGVLMANVPAVDRLLDFKLEYWPSSRYRKNFWATHDLDGAQDYTGQSYLLALHLGALPRMGESDYTYWTRYIDLAVGFEAQHFYPVPDDERPRQTLYAGLAINMQGILSAAFAESRGRRIGRGIFEVYSLPYTTLRFGESNRHRMDP